MPAYLETAKTRKKSKKKVPREISVVGIVKSQLDPQQFAKILMRAARERAEEPIDES